MVLLQKIKALLGLGGSEAEDREVGVTVERDGSTNDGARAGTATTDKPDEPTESVPDETVLGEESVEIDADSEPDGDDPLVDEETDDPLEDADESAGEPEDATAAGAGAASSTGSITEPADSPDEATESAEATGPSADDAVPESEMDAGTTGDESVDTIKGIGSAYAERLGEAGVETVGDLATADPEEVASETGIAPTRVEGWIDRAKSR